MERTVAYFMSVNVLQNGKIVKLAGAVESDVIDQAVELATKQAVATAAAYAETIVAQAGGFHTKIVDRLPAGSPDPEDEEYAAPSTLYLVPVMNEESHESTMNHFDEYMYIDSRWERLNADSRYVAISTTEVDNYFNTIN